MQQFTAYLRVSTARQGESGLGLEAQRDAVQRYAAQTGSIVAEFIEIESGKICDRPELGRAIAHCRASRSTLLIAKLDRLARNVAFVANLMEAGVDFVAADTPFANKLMVHILSAFAEHEREQISIRTKSALAAARARGVQLGKHGAILAAQNRKSAHDFALAIRSEIDDAKSQGAATASQIAASLNMRGVSARCGGEWTATQVLRVARRIEARPPTNGSDGGFHQPLHHCELTGRETR